jgi:hypothetical protein
LHASFEVGAPIILDGGEHCARRIGLIAGIVKAVLPNFRNFPRRAGACLQPLLTRYDEAE